MKHTNLILLLLILSTNALMGQVNHERARQIVLQRNQIGKEFSFVQSKRFLLDKTWLYDYDSLVLVYLEKIKTKNGKVFKIITSKWYWNTSPRATSRIVVFNSKNQYIGDYYLTMTYDVPDKIAGTSLVFMNEIDDDQCEPKLITKVSFLYGIPKHRTPYLSHKTVCTS